MVDGTSYHARGAMVTVRWLDARIYLSHTLPALHASKTITVKQHEAKLITEDTVPPVPEVLPSVRSPPHAAASPVIQSQSGTPDGTPRPKACLQCSEIGGSFPHKTRSQYETPFPIHSDQLSVFSGCSQIFWPPHLHRCGQPAYRFHCKIVLMHLFHTSNILATFHWE